MLIQDSLSASDFQLIDSSVTAPNRKNGSSKELAATQNLRIETRGSLGARYRREQKRSRIEAFIAMSAALFCGALTFGVAFILLFAV